MDARQIDHATNWLPWTRKPWARIAGFGLLLVCVVWVPLIVLWNGRKEITGSIGDCWYLAFGRRRKEADRG